jgi:uncharacterized membrane protein YagU involved in acid resistance
MIAGQVIGVSACLAGVLDLSATGILMASRGTPVKRLLQFIASGVLGTSAFEGGRRTAGIGLLFHFLIAAVAATLYFEVSRGLPIILNRPVLFGALYGVTVHLVMSCIVVPLSRTPKREFSIAAFLTQLVIHVFCVGLPIALTQSHLLQGAKGL